jgi:hypothetical protein
MATCQPVQTFVTAASKHTVVHHSSYSPLRTIFFIAACFNLIFRTRIIAREVCTNQAISINSMHELQVSSSTH